MEHFIPLTPSPALFDLQDEVQFGASVEEKRRDHENFVRHACACAEHWVQEQGGSAEALVRALEAEFGSIVRIDLWEIFHRLGTDAVLPPEVRQYVAENLTRDALQKILGSPPAQREMPSLDELFARTLQYRQSEKFVEAVNFVSRFRRYSAYNNMLVYLQNRGASFWALASQWRDEFGRTIKEDARPMLILAPMTPVLLVYDVEDTEGRPLPDKFREPFAVVGTFSEKLFVQTLENCGRDGIEVKDLRLGGFQAGNVKTAPGSPMTKMRLRLNRDLDTASRYATLCHELAHIYLGHMGNDADEWWPSRTHMTYDQCEIEAEAVAYIVCHRAGLTTKSAEYLAGYLDNFGELQHVSIDLITKVAGQIERMGASKLSPRKPKATPAATTRT